MGVERFFSNLSKQFDIITDLKKPYQRINATHLFIDFNSIIHNVSAKMISDINKFKQKKIDNLDYTIDKISDFENLLVENVKNSVKNLLSDNFISDNLNYVMLSMDGVPTFSKMMEQKKRRFIGDILHQLMKKYELPFEWSKNNISSGTRFMDILSTELKDNQFLKECKIICKNLNGILVSDIYDPGEGEMKIIENIKNLKDKSNKISVYSPDSDMILLLMIIETPITLLRYDQQKSKEEDDMIYNLINIIEFKNQLINYCKNRLDFKIDEKEIINEIVYIFTLFGDDFIPKTESINVSEDINVIINNYLVTLIDKGNILISKKEYSLNKINLKYFFSQLSKYEIKDLNRIFYDSKYINYRWAGSQNFNHDLSVFKSTMKTIVDQFRIKKGESINDFIKFIQSNQQWNDLNYKINSTKLSIKEPFYNFCYQIVKKLDGLELYKALYDNKSINFLEYKNKETKDIISKYKSLYFLKISDAEILKDLAAYMYLEDFVFPLTNFRLESNTKYQPYFKRSFEEKDHIGRMKKRDLLKEGNERDKLIYLIENKVDKYYKLFNPINFFYKSKITSINQYYDTMFSDSKDQIIIKYLQGFDWLLNYYFNNKYDSLWFYPYSRTPLLSDVSLFNKEIPSLEFNNKILFNPLESIIFITPLDYTSELDFFPKSVNKEILDLVKKFMNENQQFFINLNEINTKLASNPEELTDLLDCSISIFLSKCHHKLLERNVKPELFLKKFREIIPVDKQPIFNRL